MRISAIILAGLSAVVASAGCVGYTQPVGPPAVLSEGQKNFQAVWRASCQVLGRYYFQLDRQDRRAGIITTHPMIGRHSFEFWRPDAVRPKDVLESTVQTLLRTATVTIRPDYDGAESYTATVEVQLKRSDRKTSQVTSTSEAYGLVGAGGKPWRDESLAVRQSAIPSDTLVPLGRDEQLEAKLTEEIQSATVRLLGGPRRDAFAEGFRRIFGQDPPTLR